MIKKLIEMPNWTVSAGGEDLWRKWAKRQANRCAVRARKWLEKRKSRRRCPGVTEWLDAILNAMPSCNGRGHYSCFPLRLDHKLGPTYAMWPSIEHLIDPATATVAVETRLVNDMATITSEAEFANLVGHLAKTMRIKGVRLDDDWHPNRNFAIEQPDDEPPLPS